MIDAKPAKRYRASHARWLKMRLVFSSDSCWVCGREGWDDLHHILPRSHSGDDVVANLAPLHRHCHNLVESRDPYARARLRGSLMPSNYDYLSEKFGAQVGGWLDANYSVAV